MIEDEFTHIPNLTRQQRLYLRRRRDDLCVTCGKPKSGSSELYCVTHEEANKVRARKRGGFRKWRPGGPGRRPRAQKLGK